MMQLHGKHKTSPEEFGGLEPMLRHMVLNSIRAHYKKNSGRFGDLTIACESRAYWRKELFPYYKAARKKGRDESTLDWDKLFQHFDTIKAEVKEYFPYRVVQVPNAEADDIIGTLVKNVAGKEEVLIISNDHDFVQLHGPHVMQFSPIGEKKVISHPDPARFKVEHIIGGDTGDGIPNILSDDDCLVVGKRQSPMTAKRLAEYSNIAMNGLEWPEERLLRNYKRNESLIDLDKIPQNVQDGIVSAWENEAGKDDSRVYEYFISRRLKNLMENVNDFV